LVSNRRAVSFGLQDVRAAAGRLRGVANRTPVVTSRTIDGRTGGTILIKAESFQRGGAFKFRGAYNKIVSLTKGVRGVATYSSGNHSQAVALAARLVGLSAVVVMPRDAPPAKLAATEGYGAEVILYDRYGEDRERLGAAVAAERGFALVPPYDDPLVMAGQGTAALELIEEAGPLDVLVVPVGGGGLIAGSATAATAMSPGIRVIGVEPEAGDDTRRSLAAGRRVHLPDVPRTIADGLQAITPGALTFPINRRLVDEVVTVSDEAIVAAMAFLFERMKLVVEPSGAVGLAALLDGRIEAEGRRVGVILSGGNVAPDAFAALIHGRASARRDTNVVTNARRDDGLEGSAEVATKDKGGGKASKKPAQKDLKQKRAAKHSKKQVSRPI
jgi:threonine dehydratase